jgi:hypothetical protein
MIKNETIGNSKEKFTRLECNQCKKVVILPEKINKDDIESKGWYAEKKKNLHLCPDCVKKDEEKRKQEKTDS